MSATVVAINTQYREMRALLHTQLADQQKVCTHPKVAHYPSQDGFRPGFPRRICTECGFEEEGSWWSYRGSFWHAKGFGPATLDNQQGREIVIVEALDDFCRLRPCV